MPSASSGNCRVTTCIAGRVNLSIYVKELDAEHPGQLSPVTPDSTGWELVAGGMQQTVGRRRDRSLGGGEV